MGLGAVLRQKSKPIAYISSVVGGAELNYSIYEREVLVISWVFKKFEYLLLRQKLKIKKSVAQKELLDD